MLADDVELIRRTLAGDDSAFAALIKKHQKGVHALVFRKVGDYQDAEELTQDVFIQVYKKLGTLKTPKCFEGWLYVIANRRALNWMRRRKLPVQSIEDTPLEEIEESSYSHYITQTRAAETQADRTAVVKKLLAKLPESERTVVTLYYLGEMTTKEIGNFLGVSVNTIKSRLRRGRERLQSAESLVSEVLGSVQLPADLTARVMRQVADIHPNVPPAGKPILPWAALGAATLCVVVMLGASRQYFRHFQKPYSFEATSEPTIDIVDDPIVIDVLSTPATRRQWGRFAAPGRGLGAGTGFTEATLTTSSEAELRQFSKDPWARTNSPPGGHVHDIFTSQSGSVTAVTRMGMYKLEAHTTIWRSLNTSQVPIDDFLMPVAEHQGTLYIVSTDAIFASSDDGETWNTFSARPKGDAVGFIITDTQNPSMMTMYLALRDHGIFRSITGGVEWVPLNDGLTGERISAITAVDPETVLTGTNGGLYRLEAELWRKLPVGTAAPENAVYSLAVLQGGTYVGMGPDLDGLTPDAARAIMEEGDPSSGRIFRSMDLGTSWTDITPHYRPSALPSGTKLLATGDILLALGATNLRSTDGGNTWTHLGIDTNLSLLNSYPAVAVNDRTFYKAGVFGIHRTTDAGKSWHIFMDGMLGTKINDLIVFNNRLYAHTAYEVYQSTDEARSWKKVQPAPSVTAENVPAYIYADFDARFVTSGGHLYLIYPEKNALRVFRLSTETDGDPHLIPVQGIPAFARQNVSLQEPGTREVGPLAEATGTPVQRGVKVKAFAVSRDVFYAEYRRRLFKWRPGDSAWTHTGLVDRGEPPDAGVDPGFQLAVSGETVYVGMRDGRLFHSPDEGRNWRDVTPSLPLGFTDFKAIFFAGTRVYVATDRGVLTSETGYHWRVILERDGRCPVIHQFAIDPFAVKGARVYGVGDQGAYRLDPNGDWHRFSSQAPKEVVSLAILNRRLYGATIDRGLFHISLLEE